MILAFYSSKNAHGKKDATGAFIPMMTRFCDLHGVPKSQRIGIDCVNTPRIARQNKVCEAIASIGSIDYIDTLAFFMHGWPNGIQCGINKSELPNFVEFMAGYCDTGVNVVLYTCLTAENETRDGQRKRLGPATDGGFADIMRDEMSANGLVYGWVDAHKTAGHTVWNPFVVRFPCRVRPQHAYPELYTGGAWLVEPGSQYWHRWCERSDLDFKYPFMTQREILNDL